MVGAPMKSTKIKTCSAMIQSTSDLAQCLNLSRWTISRVLNGHTGVALETTRRVRNAMRDLGFSPNSLPPRSGSTQAVCASGSEAGVILVEPGRRCNEPVAPGPGFRRSLVAQANLW